MGLLEGRTALITGGARGQGRAHATLSANEGADVILVDVADQSSTVDYGLATAEDMKETVRLVEAIGKRELPVVGDVRSQEDLDEAVRVGLAEFGKIDILIANAGICSYAPFWQLTEAQWDEMIGVNLTGVWKSAKAVAPHMIERQSGSIVGTSSVNGFEPGVNYAHYTASKHGVIGLTKNLAIELAPFGVRCNSVAPAGVNTPMTFNQTVWDMMAGHPNASEEEYYELGRNWHALKGATVMPPEVVAKAALFLNSDLASAITGAILPVDSGHLLLPGLNMNPTK